MDFCYLLTVRNTIFHSTAERQYHLFCFGNVLDTELVWAETAFMILHYGIGEG